MDFYPTPGAPNLAPNWFWPNPNHAGAGGAISLISQSEHLIPYAILTINFILFKLLRSFVDKIVAYYTTIDQPEKKPSVGHISGSGSSNGVKSRKISSTSDGGNINYIKLLKLFIDELISTCELCTDCAELNVVYEKHGSMAYGLSLFILTYLWMDAFGEAHTTPGYLVEDYFLINGSQTLKTGSTYARFIGQSMAMPLAWRFASLYWGYKLLGEHREMLMVDNCKSALSTSTLNGYLIEFICCMLCRLIELYGHRILENNGLVSKRIVSLTTSFLCTSLVVMALELSGGYFNPILASGLEFGCKGASLYQHALVFWLGPLTGHVMARGLFKWLAPPSSEQQQVVAHNKVDRGHSTSGGGGGNTSGNSRGSATAAGQSKRISGDGQKQQHQRLTRSSSQKKNTKKHLD